MKLAEIFKSLERGEVSKVLIGNAENGGIYPYYSDEVSVYINEALHTMCMRFPLIHKEIVVQPYSGMDTYHLRSEFAVNNDESNEPIKYLMDTPENPFVDDLLVIDAIYLEDGTKFLINAESSPDAFINESLLIRQNIPIAFLPLFDTVQINQVNEENQFSVIYRCNHTDVTPSIDRLPEDIEVHIPRSLLNALLAYVGYRAFDAVGSPDSVQTGYGYLQRYETECLKMENLGVLQLETYARNQFEDNRWV